MRNMTRSARLRRRRRGAALAHSARADAHTNYLSLIIHIHTIATTVKSYLFCLYETFNYCKYLVHRARCWHVKPHCTILTDSFDSNTQVCPFEYMVLFKVLMSELLSVFLRMFIMLRFIYFSIDCMYWRIFVY